MSGKDSQPTFSETEDIKGHGQALARQLMQHGWEVKIASRHAHSRMAEVYRSDLDVQPFEGLTKECLGKLGADRARAVICLYSDEDNLKLCELFYEHFATETMIVNMHDRSYLESFRELGVLVIDSGTALVSLMDHCVRSPAATPLMMGGAEMHAPGPHQGHVHQAGPVAHQRLEMAREHRPDLVAKIGELVRGGSVELLTGGLREPILTVLPELDAIGQVRAMSDELQARFGAKPEGAWLTERVYEPRLPTPLSSANRIASR